LAFAAIFGIREKENTMLMLRSVLFLVLSFVCSTFALTQGLYGGKHWSITMNNDEVSGTVEGDCSSGTLSSLVKDTYASGVGTYVNFSMSVTLQFKAGTANAGVTKAITVSDGLLGTDNATLTGTMVSGTYSEQFKVVHLAPADMFKCVSSAGTVKVQYATMFLALFALAWLQQ